jgi:hypothetical protein
MWKRLERPEMLEKLERPIFKSGLTISYLAQKSSLGYTVT